MLKTICPQCDTPLRGPDDFAGKRPRCPECRAAVPAPGIPMGTGPAPKSGEDALLDTLLAEVGQSPAPGGAVLAEAAPAALKSKPAKPVLRPKPKRSQTPIIVGVLAIVLVTLAGAWWAVRYIRASLALNNARVQARRVERDEPALMRHIENAEAFVEAGDYPAAKDAYEAALATGERLLDDTRAALAGVAIESARAPLKEAETRLSARVETVRAALETPEIVKGSQGLVLFQGNWVTPEERDELFRQRMLDQGRQYYEEFEQWMTEEEYHVAKGHVQYKGKWMTPAQYEQVKADEERQEKEGEAHAAAEAERLAEERRRQQEERRQREEAARRERESQYPPDAERWVLDDFEAGENQWRVQNWGNPANVEVVSHRGSQRLRLTAEQGGTDKVAIARPLRIDLSGRDAIELDIENATDSRVNFAIAVQTSEFFESRMIPVRPGSNNGLQVALDAGDFKAESTGWNHTTKAENLDSIRQVFLLIYTRRAGIFYIDNIAAVKAQ